MPEEVLYVSVVDVLDVRMMPLGFIVIVMPPMPCVAEVLVVAETVERIPSSREGLRRDGVAEHLRPQLRIREVQHVRRGHAPVVERGEERVRNLVFPRVPTEVPGAEPDARDVGERIRGVPGVDPPAALDLRPGERCRVHAVPERAALEELLLFQSDRQYKAFLFTGISEALASAQGSCRSASG